MNATMIMIQELKNGDIKAVLHMDESIIIGDKAKWNFEAVGSTVEEVITEVIHIARKRGVSVETEAITIKRDEKKSKTIKMW